MPPPTSTDLVTHLAIQDLDVNELREAQEEAGNSTLSVLDLETFAPCHPDNGLGSEAYPGLTQDFAIIHHHPGRIYYEGPYDETGSQPKTPPLCVSWDGLTGEGNPGGVCAACPFGQFGEKCKPVYHLYGLQEESFMPVHITIPRTSLKSKPGSPPKPSFFSLYVLTIRKPLTSFMVRMSTKRRGEGKAGKIVVFEKGPDIAPEVSKALKEYAVGFRAMMAFPGLQDQKLLSDPTQRELLESGTKAGARQYEEVEEVEDDDDPFAKHRQDHDVMDDEDKIYEHGHDVGDGPDDHC